MTRSPLFYPLSRGIDAEGGGAADLQTDVMRFMAILSLCLMAIFALVQSIPLAPVMPEPAQTEATPALQSTEPEPEPVIEQVIEPETEIRLTRPAPAKMVVRQEQVVLQRPTREPVRRADPMVPDDALETTIADAQPSKEGFTLQFETDAALTRLVARQIVGFYAITPNKSLRMNIDNNEISFWPASLPAKFHEMDESTVPEAVLAAYRNGNSMTGLKWGVTLPADMSRELSGYLSSNSGGALVIAGNGQIDLRR